MGRIHHGTLIKCGSKDPLVMKEPHSEKLRERMRIDSIRESHTSSAFHAKSSVQKSIRQTGPGISASSRDSSVSQWHRSTDSSYATDPQLMNSYNDEASTA